MCRLSGVYADLIADGVTLRGGVLAELLFACFFFFLLDFVFFFEALAAVFGGVASRTS